MASANKKKTTESKKVTAVKPTQPEEATGGPEPRPRPFVTMATDGETVSSPVRTTRELYMELTKDVEKN